MSRRICVIGTGYVGMACMIGFAELGYSVSGFDIISERIQKLRIGIAPYREAGIEDRLHEHITAGRLSFHDSVREAASSSDVVIVAVGTPSREDGSADLSALYSAFEMLSNVDFVVWPTVVVRSTVPPGTSDTLADLVEGWGELIYAPEFLREGSAVPDFLNPDRIVVGCTSPASAIPYVRLFETMQKPVVFTSRCNAELIKCCSNAFLALKISFANEVANLCDALGGTSDDVLRGIGYDRRIGSEFLKPGIGFGGPCFEKDLKSIQHVAGTLKIGRELFSATLRVNEAQVERLVNIVEEQLGSIEGKTIGVWGLAFKAGTDDIRDSLALRIIEMLVDRKAQILAYDPAVHVAPLPGSSRLVHTALEAAKADALLVLTDWAEFAKIPPSAYAESIRLKTVIDGRNVLDEHRVIAAGLSYRGIGRPSNAASRPIQVASGL